METTAATSFQNSVLTKTVQPSSVHEETRNGFGHPTLTTPLFTLNDHKTITTKKIVVSVHPTTQNRLFNSHPHSLLDSLLSDLEHNLFVRQATVFPEERPPVRSCKPLQLYQAF